MHDLSFRLLRVSASLHPIFKFLTDWLLFNYAYFSFLDCSVSKAVITVLISICFDV